MIVTLGEEALAARISAPRTAEVAQVDRPVPSDGEVVLKVLACGLCGSDLNAWRGVPGIEYPLPPGAPGHEVWAEVVELGSGTATGSLTIGTRVTGLVQNGYARYALARADELLALPSLEGDEVILGEPLACAANVARRSGWRPGERIAVVGFGYLAALVVQLMFSDNQGDWVAISRRLDSRTLALELGARAVYGFDAVPDDLWDTFPVVIEAAGVQQALDHATWLTAYGGRLVIAGYHADGPRIVNVQSWNWKGIDVINAHERRPEAYMRGLRNGVEIVTDHNLNLPGLITHRWPLSRIAEAFDMADRRAPGYVKGIVLPWAG